MKTGRNEMAVAFVFASLGVWVLFVTTASWLVTQEAFSKHLFGWTLSVGAFCRAYYLYNNRDNIDS